MTAFDIAWDIVKDFRFESGFPGILRQGAYDLPNDEPYVNLASHVADFKTYRPEDKNKWGPQVFRSDEELMDRVMRVLSHEHAHQALSPPHSDDLWNEVSMFGLDPNEVDEDEKRRLQAKIDDDWTRFQEYGAWSATQGIDDDEKWRMLALYGIYPKVEKAVLPDLPFDANLQTILGYNPWLRGDGVTYEVSVEPDVARDLLSDKPYYESISSIDKKKNPGAFKAWDRELRDNPMLFRFPHHIFERITGRNTDHMRMPYDRFAEYATQDSWRDEFSDLELDPMNAYIDEAEARDMPVVVGAGDYDRNRKKLSRVMTNPGFGGRGIGQHILGSMLQDNEYLRDNQWSLAGAKAFHKLGQTLTSGGEATALPLLQGEVDPDDFYSKYYQGRGLVDTILGDIRYTQPYGFGNPRITEGYWYDTEDGGMRYDHPSEFPIEHEQIRPGTNIDPELVGRYPMSLRYTGDDPHFITNLGRKVA